MFDFYPRYEALFAQLQLALFMFGLGATLALRDFVDVVRKPRSLIVAYLGHLLAMPALAWATNRLFGLDGGIAVGIALASAMPGGTLSKAFSYLGRGNVALAIALTVASTLSALFAVPLVLHLLAGDQVAGEIRMPVQAIVVEIALFLVAPTLAGMGVARLFPACRATLGRWAIRAGFAVVLLVVVSSLGSGRIKPGEHGWRVPLAIIFFVVAGMQLNMLPFRLCGWPRADTFTAGIEVTMRNMNLAILVKAVLFPEEAGGEVARLGGETMFVILFYAASAMGAGLPLALNFRRMARNEDRADAHSSSQ